VYISKMSPGSVLAKDGRVAVGDRILSVNEKSVEHKTAKVKASYMLLVCNLLSQTVVH